MHHLCINKHLTYSMKRKRWSETFAGLILSPRWNDPFLKWTQLFKQQSYTLTDIAGEAADGPRLVLSYRFSPFLLFHPLVFTSL